MVIIEDGIRYDLKKAVKVAASDDGETTETLYLFPKGAFVHMSTFPSGASYPEPLTATKWKVLTPEEGRKRFEKFASLGCAKVPIEDILPHLTDA